MTRRLAMAVPSLRPRVGVLGMVCGVLAGCPADDPVPPDDTDTPAVAAEPFRSPMRRLAARELSNVWSDLLEVPVDAVSALPPETPSYGFDHVSEAQALSDSWLVQAAEVVDRAVDHALGLDTVSERALSLDDVTDWTESFEVEDGRSGWVGYGLAAFEVPFSVETSGHHRITIDATWATGWEPLDPEPPPEVWMALDGVEIARETLEQTGRRTEPLTAFVDLSAGEHTLRFVNDFPGRTVGWVALRIDGPRQADGRLPIARLDRLMPCLPGAVEGGEDDVATCASAALAPFVRTAWRRPVSDEALDRIVGWVVSDVEGGMAFEHALATAYSAVLLSPDHLFLPEPVDPGDIDTWQPLSDHALAARLSFTLWSTHPDEALRACADAGTLRTDDPACGLSAQIDRLLADPRADRLVDSYFQRWLGTIEALETPIDPGTFPHVDDAFREAAVAEAAEVQGAVVRGERSLQDLLSGRTTVINADLAAHYGLGDPPGGQWAEVDLPAARTGLITQAAFALATSLPARTSPSRRGHQVVSAWLCADIDGPPPNVPELGDGGGSLGTLREQMEAHGSLPGCSTCHDQFDPVGFALDGIGVDGTLRDTVDGHPVDTTVTLDDGTVVDGAASLAAAISPEAFARCAAERFAIHATATLPDVTLDERVQAWADQGLDGSFHDVVHAVLTDELFTHRRGVSP